MVENETENINPSKRQNSNENDTVQRFDLFFSTVFFITASLYRILVSRLDNNTL
jgi:hypothetical protein